MYSWGRELTLDTVESSRYKLVTTEDEGPMTLVLLDVIELVRSTFACEYPLTLERVESSRYRLVTTEDEGPMTLVLFDVTELVRSTFACEYPDVEAEGPRDNDKLSTSVQRTAQRSNNAFWEETSFLQDGESVWGLTNWPGW